MRVQRHDYLKKASLRPAKTIVRWQLDNMLLDEIKLLHPRAKLTCIIFTWSSRLRCIFASDKCTSKRQPGQRERTRHDSKMQGNQADEKKIVCTTRQVCVSLSSAPCSTNHGFSKSMIGTHDWICYLMIAPPMQVNFARGGAKFWISSVESNITQALQVTP